MILSSTQPTSGTGVPIKTVGTTSRFYEGDVLEWENVPIDVRFDRDHDNLLDADDVSDAHRARLLGEYLDALSEVCPDPRLMPLKESSKEPAIIGQCELDSDDARSLLHTPREAIDAVADGHTGFCLYAGKEAHNTENIVLVDHDDLDTFPEDTLRETLTVCSGSGRGVHETFVNDGSVENATGTNGYDGEIRASNWECALPGTVHPSGGIYHVTTRVEVTTLSETDLPSGLRPSSPSSSSSTTSFDATSREADTDDYTNERGYSLEEIRDMDWKLDTLLSDRYPDFVGHTDDSRIDATLVSKLRYHHFTHSQIVSIWKQYRPRAKLEREDYVARTIQKCATHNDRWEYYDRTEDLDWIEDVVAFFPMIETNSSWNDDGLTQSVARNRCTRVVERALENGEHTIIEAIPSLGKSYSVPKAAESTNVSTTILTERHDLYEQYVDWCEERDLDYYELPSFYEQCPTANGEHGSTWERRIKSAYNRGLTGSDIHTHDAELFGESLPCDDGHECSYKSNWSNFDPDEYDVLIGNYVHAYNPTITEGRTVVFDEFPASSFVESFDANTVTSSVTRFLQTHDELPFEDKTDLIEHRSDDFRHDTAVEWFMDDGLDRDTSSVLGANGRGSDERISADTHALAPLMTYALLDGRDLGNKWEHSRLELGSDDGRLATCVSARNRDSGELFVLRPPQLSEANGVICLDGTPQESMWRMVVDENLGHQRVLSDEERCEYLTDVLGITVVPMTNSANHYSGGKYVDPERDGVLFDSVRHRYHVRPSLISTKKAVKLYNEAGVLTAIDDVDSEDDCRESDKIGWYGSFKGSNEFGDDTVGIISGTQHFGDTYMEKWGALANESTEHVDGTTKMNRQYSTDLGNDVLTDMREHEVFQAIMRFERGDGGGATVFVNTAAMLDWIPVEDGGSIERISDGMKTVVGAIDDVGPKFRTNEITDHTLVHVSDQQVRNILYKLSDYGHLSYEKQSGRATKWTVGSEFTRTFFDVDHDTESIDSASDTPRGVSVSTPK